jgi:hypothetical protein
MRWWRPRPAGAAPRGISRVSAPMVGPGTGWWLGLVAQVTRNLHRNLHQWV